MPPSMSGESILPRLHSDFNPFRKKNQEEFFEGKKAQLLNANSHGILEYTGFSNVFPCISEKQETDSNAARLTS
jgi:hypothetical protein